MCQEEVGHLFDPGADFLAAEMNGLADDVGVELLALGYDGGEERGADGSGVGHSLSAIDSRNPCNH
jgi:hypothetical protein